ncbi:MAG: VWA domain-containing protein [Candidatus Acidoferrales bacterium]|nr:VWA domain-containing protein [Candidatus Acidoferrales bacterium]
MFQVRTNLVLVPVVVRDARGRSIANLKREDFELFDRGKAQTITRFSFEGAAGGAAGTGRSADQAADRTAAPPGRFVAYLFDDLHLGPEEITRARSAVEQTLAGVLGAAARVGIFTTSGRTTLEFTAERAQIADALAALAPHPAGDAGGRPCPDVSYYQADQIINRRSQDALDTATLETVNCAGLDARGPTARQVMQQAERMAQAEAEHALSAGERGRRIALGAMNGIVRRMAAQPGEKAVELVSPGFPTEGARRELGLIVDAAARWNVVVNTLDARGLFVADPTTDVTNQTQTADPKLLLLLGRDTIDLSRQAKTRWLREAIVAQQATLESLADDTGGAFVHNSNDLAAGFERTAGAPEGRYILGFSPEIAQPDGSFHELKVTLRNVKGASVQARRGYFSPAAAGDPAETAKREIEDAVYSREGIHGIPTEVKTQFFKPASGKARLSVVARIDVSGLHYRKEGGRNRDDLTVVSAVFDENGNYVAGVRRAIEMRLRDQTLANAEGVPVAVKSDFEVKPGAYVVRVVVRDSEGERMTAQTSMVQIPW